MTGDRQGLENGSLPQVLEFSSCGSTPEDPFSWGSRHGMGFGLLGCPLVVGTGSHAAGSICKKTLDLALSLWDPGWRCSHPAMPGDVLGRAEKIQKRFETVLS